MISVYFLNKPLISVSERDLDVLLEKGYVIKPNGRYVLSNCKELRYLFSPNIKPFKKELYLKHINSKRFTCEDCGKKYSFHVRPMFEKDGSINFKKIVCVCKECRTKHLVEKDILVPQFKTKINWPEEYRRIKKENQRKEYIR